jgi:cobalt-zinc-cadmium efflux system membrane fusion protein
MAAYPLTFKGVFSAMGSRIARVSILAVWLAPVAPLIAMAQQQPATDSDIVRSTADQMHQLGTVKVERFAFRVQKFAIGQIAYNEDTSTAVLTPFSGRVARLIAKVGDNVKRGDPLFEIDSHEVVGPQNDFVAAITALNKARSQLALAEIAQRRAKDLFESKAGPLKELQTASAQLIAAQNDLRAAEVALEAGRNRLRILGRDDPQIDALQQRGAIDRTAVIRSPIDGTVIARKVGPGQYVRGDSADALYSVADLTTMWLKAFVPETDIPYIRVGQEIEVNVTALPQRSFRAHIAIIASSSDALTRRVVVRSELPNPDKMLKAEMFATFKIVAGPDQLSPSVPIEAVIREGGTAWVWVQREPMLYVRRTIVPGMEQNGRVQVRSGLDVGETVVARGAIFINNEWHQ